MGYFFALVCIFSISSNVQKNYISIHLNSLFLEASTSSPVPWEFGSAPGRINVYREYLEQLYPFTC